MKIIDRIDEYFINEDKENYTFVDGFYEKRRLYNS